MKKKIQKWYKLKGFGTTWTPCRDEDYFGNINDFEFYYTPEGKHPFEIMKLEQDLYDRKDKNEKK